MDNVRWQSQVQRLNAGWYRITRCLRYSLTACESMLASSYNDMKMQFVFRNWYELLIIDNYSLGVSTSWPNTLVPNGGSAPTLISDVWGEYALVSNMERVQMGKAPRDMLIQQVQTAPGACFTASSVSCANNLFNIHFAHAIKALFFGVQNITNSSEWSNYTSASPVPTAVGVVFSPALATDPIAATSLFYENTQRLSNMGSDYFSLIQPWYTAVSIPLETGYHMYSYALDLISSNPLGSTNYGKLTNVSLSFTASSDAVIAAAATGTLAAPGPLASQGAGIPQVFQAIVLGLNWNIIRIAGGALGLTWGGLKRQVPDFVQVWVNTYCLVVIAIMCDAAKHLIMSGSSLELQLPLTC